MTIKQLKTTGATALAFFLLGNGIVLAQSRPDILIADFEGADYGHWKAKGAAFGSEPAHGTVLGQQEVAGFEEKGLVNSFNGGEDSTGKLTSPEFKIERKFIAFLIGGGGWTNKACMNLLVYGKVVRTATGPNTGLSGSEKLAPRSWDVTDLAGKAAQIQIVDNAPGSRGHVNVEQIVLSDEPGKGRNAAMIFMASSGSWWWDPSIIWQDGQYRLFAMLKPHGSDIENSVLYATSKDGVHWQDHGAVLTSTRPDTRVWKMFVGQCGDRFIMDHGAFSKKGGPDNDTLCFYESKDLRHWSYIGENHPDPLYYNPQGRWDHMYMLPKDEGNPAAGYWGYVVANPNQEMIDQGRGMGMMESADGRKWTQLPPPKIDCGRFPPIASLEVGGCERLNGKYYLIGGYANVMGQFSYSMYTLVSDSPTGPFKLDQDAWRLCGSSGYPGRWGVQFLATFARGKDEILIGQYIAIGQQVWLVPLKKAVVDIAGHLHMGYWKNNEAAKGASINLDTAASHLEYPPVPATNAAALASPVGLEIAPGRIKIVPEFYKGEDYLDRQALAILGETFEPSQGVILEGTIKPEHWPARARPAYAGFYIEQKAGNGLAILMQLGHPSLCRSLIGNLSLTPKWSFECLDETGPGCATVTGLDWDRPHSFRLWLKNNAVELYIDDILMQTFITTGMTGRVGVLSQNAPVTFGDLRTWKMEL